jgi:hypothetical protein
MRENDDLDLLLDSALKTYADASPNDGLEHRVLARIAATRKAPEPEQAPRRWLPWAIALPLAAGVLLIFLAAPKAKNSPSQHAQNTLEAKHDPGTPVQNQPSPAFGSAEPQNPGSRVPRARSLSSVQATETARLPKQDVFPTPQPLTSEEQALVVFVARAPQQEREAVAEAQLQIESPISVAAIHIPLLESPDKGKP